MKNRTLPALVTSALLVLTPAFVGVGSKAAARVEASPGEPVKIMLGGDSITQGFDGDYTWRYRLDRELTRQNVDFDFVGPRRYTYGGANHYQVARGWDTDHGATGGTRLRTQLEEVSADVYDYQPDVLVALYGTTDLLPRPAGYPNPTVALDEEIADLRDYIQRARDAVPEGAIDIILGEVTTRRIPNRQEFNDALKDLAVEQDKRFPYTKSRVVVADLDYPGWTPEKYTYDTTHPNPIGEAVIAQRIGWALKSIEVLPGNPAISAAGLKWAPPWAPKIRVSKTRRLVVDWAATKFQNKPQLMRVWVKDLRRKKAGVSGWTSASRYVSKRKKPGRYRIRVQGRRQTMVSPWSRTWTVRVKRR